MPVSAKTRKLMSERRKAYWRSKNKLKIKKYNNGSGVPELIETFYEEYIINALRNVAIKLTKILEK